MSAVPNPFYEPATLRARIERNDAIRKTREDEISDARAMLRKHEIRSADELLAAINHVLGSVHTPLIDSLMQEYHGRLTDLACDLDTATNNPNPAKSERERFGNSPALLALHAD
jgi:hypothetical protein